MDTEINEAAERFLKFDYGETKDLLKTFITLASASLVLSLTFSEKMVGFTTASTTTQYMLFGSWVLLVVSLICAGIGMCFIAAAAGKILYGELPIFNLDYFRLSLISWTFGLAAGITFVGALFTMTVAAAHRIYCGQ